MIIRMIETILLRISITTASEAPVISAMHGALIMNRLTMTRWTSPTHGRLFLAEKFPCTGLTNGSTEER